MTSFVKLRSNGGIWADREQALAYISQGYPVYEDESCTVQLSEEDVKSSQDSKSANITDTIKRIGDGENAGD